MERFRNPLSLLALVIIPVLLVGGLARAEVYLFVDSEGIYHFTNVPSDTRYKRHGWAGNSRGGKRAVSAGERAQIRRTIKRTAERFELEAALIQAVVKVESNYDPLAISSAGALGLMQLMPSTALRWSVDNPLDPVQNIRGGVRHLRHLYDLFEGDIPLALAAYHAGERRVQQHRGIPPIDSTQNYVQKVLRYYDRYREADSGQPAVYRFTLPNGAVAYGDSPEAYPGREAAEWR